MIDTAIVLDALSARRPRAGRRPFAEAARSQPGALRIAVSYAFPAGVAGRLTPEVRAALDGTVELLRGLGHTVVERDVDFRPRDVPVILGLLFRAIHDFVGEVERPARLERRSRALARPGALVSDRTQERLLAAEQRMTERVGRLFDDHHVLLTPMMSQPAVPTGLMEGRGATVTYMWETGWVPFNVALERDRPARRVGSSGLLRGRPATRGPDRGAAARRGARCSRSRRSSKPPGRGRTAARPTPRSRSPCRRRSAR